MKSRCLFTCFYSFCMAGNWMILTDAQLDGGRSTTTRSTASPSAGTPATATGSATPSTVASQTGSTAVPDLPAESTTTKTPVTTQTPLLNPVVKYQDFGGCGCDLIENGCDINCCCDPNCNDADRASFSADCGAELHNDLAHREICFSEGLLLQNSSILPSFRRPSSGDVCLIYDNNPQRLFYQEPAAVDSTAQYDAPWKARNLKSPIFQSSPGSLDEDITRILQHSPSSPAFKVGDPIFTIRNTDRSLRKLQFPSSGSFSTRCVAPEAIKFLTPADSLCSHAVDRLATDCVENPFFQINSFINFDVIRSAAVFSAINTSADFASITDSALRTFTVPVHLTGILDTARNVYAVRAENAPTLIPSFSAATNTCLNAVKGVAYTFVYDGSSITAVNLSVVFASIRGSNGSFEQSFQASFVSATIPGDELVRSGNPGYLDGSAVLVATVLDPTVNQSMPADYLALPGLSPDGGCGNADQLERISFGENMQMSCTVLVDVRDPSMACLTLQTQLMAAMSINGSGNFPTNVGVYGNSTRFSADGWIPILRQITTADMSFVPPNICRNIVTGVSIEVASSKVGFLSNPQAKITGVLYRFTDPVDVMLECPFGGCKTGTLLPVEVQFAVSFNDFTKSAVDLRSLQPSTSRFLPTDFFSPY